jgi:hypothetical protein
MQDKRELWLALLTIVLISVGYVLFVFWQGIPAASEFFGHSLGVVGFILMLSTETLYSLRKRAIRRPWGKLRTWLRFHIFSGIVGPYLVFLHSAWGFRGLAGVVLLLTVIVVISGFVGRYIYTAVPRTADGMVWEEQMVQDQLQALEAELKAQGPELPEGVELDDLAPRRRGPVGIYQEVQSYFMRRRVRQHMDPEAAEALEKMVDARRRSRELRRSLDSLATARRLLAVWHTVHIPLGMALFVAAFVHIGAALYYATLLR